MMGAMPGAWQAQNQYGSQFYECNLDSALEEALKRAALLRSASAAAFMADQTAHRTLQAISGRGGWSAGQDGVSRTGRELQIQPGSPPLCGVERRGPQPSIFVGDGHASAFRPTAAGLQRCAETARTARKLHERAHVGAAGRRPLEEDSGVYSTCALPVEGPATPPEPSGFRMRPSCPPRCHVNLMAAPPDKLGQPPQRSTFNVTATSGTASMTGMNGLLQALGLADTAPRPPVIKCGPPPAAPQAPRQRHKAEPPKVYHPLPRRVLTGSPRARAATAAAQPASAPSSPPATPPRLCQARATGPRSLARVPRSPELLRLPELLRAPQGRVTKAKSPERHQPHKPPRSRAGGGGSGGSGGNSHAAWTEADKAALMALVKQAKPCGAAEWEDVAHRLGAKGGAAAERMYRTLGKKGYVQSSNRHGCRLNPRDGTPMHVMVEYALQQLPGHEGNIDAIAAVVEASHYAGELDHSARPGTKTYPRFRDTILGCFKTGRYRHLVNTHQKVLGKNIYKLIMPSAETAREEQGL